MSVAVLVQEPSAKYLVNLQPPLVRHFDLIAQAPGGVARLRELILTLAVQGKLVPQDDSDEPASELLKKIRAEKDRLIAEGKIKQDKPLAEIADEEQPFELPHGWQWVRLNALLQKIGAGSTPLGGKEVYVSSGVKFLRSQNVWDDGLKLSSVAYIRPETHAKMAGTVVLPNDLLFNITGASIGRCALVPTDFDEANVSQHVTIVRTVLPVLNAFLHKVLVSRHVQQTVMDVQVGVSREGLSITKLGNFLIPVPPLAEQSRIATHFDMLLDRPEAVEALEQTILQLAVRGLLVPQDPTDEPASILLQKIRTEKDHLIAQGKIKRDKPLPPITDEEKPFELPKGWEWARFPELGEFARGKSKHRPRNDPALFNPPIYPVVQTGEVARAKGVIQAYHSKYSEVGLAQSRLWPEGTLCITIAANIADAALLGFDACFPDSVVGFVPAQTLGNVKYFLAFMETARNDLIKFAPATAQKNINLEILEALLIPVPPVAEISRIVTRFNELRSLCSDLRQRLAAQQSNQIQLAGALIKNVTL